VSMTGNIDWVEVITSVQRRRRWSAEEKAAIVQETHAPGMSVSLVARRQGIAPLWPEPNCWPGWSRRLNLSWCWSSESRSPFRPARLRAGHGWFVWRRGPSRCGHPDATTRGAL
jgi:hypothetical protein